MDEVQSSSVQREEPEPTMIYGSDEALPDRDGLAGNVIFCAWTGDSPMSSKSADVFTPVNVYQSYLTHNQKRYCEMASYDESVSSGLSLSERDPQGRLPARLSHASLRWRVHRSEGRLATVYGLGFQEIGPDGSAPCATQRIKN